MKIVTFALCTLAVASVAYGQKADCAKMKAAVEKYGAAASIQMSTMAGVAIMLETGDAGLVSRVGKRMENGIALTVADPTLGAEIIKATKELIRARDAVLAASGCLAAQGSPK